MHESRKNPSRHQGTPLTLRVGGGDNCSPVAARPSITAFFPCYNDAGTIASIVVTTDRTLRELADDYEIIVANDASTDNSALILDELSARYPRLRVIHHTTNHGYGGNLRSMFALATKDLIFYTDGDWRHSSSAGCPRPGSIIPLDP